MIRAGVTVLLSAACLVSGQHDTSLPFKNPPAASRAHDAPAGRARRDEPCQHTGFSAATPLTYNDETGTSRDITGLKPNGDGPWPVFMFMRGTFQPNNDFGGLDCYIGQEMASRGFLTLMVDYNNGAIEGLSLSTLASIDGSAYPRDCTTLYSKAVSLFSTTTYDAEGSVSALSTICASSDADCDGGVAVSGWSQGANLATVADSFDDRVTAKFLYAGGLFATTTDPYDSPCLAHGLRGGCHDTIGESVGLTPRLPASRVRSIVGSRDQFFAGSKTVAGAQQHQSHVTGTCDRACTDGETIGWWWWRTTGVNCFDQSGGGYAVFPRADHTFVLGMVPGGFENRFILAGSPGYYGWDPAADFDWIAQTAVLGPPSSDQLAGSCSYNSCDSPQAFETGVGANATLAATSRPAAASGSGYDDARLERWLTALSVILAVFVVIALAALITMAFQRSDRRRADGQKEGQSLDQAEYWRNSSVAFPQSRLTHQETFRSKFSVVEI